MNGLENARVGGGAGGTNLHPFVMIVLLIAILLTLLLPRKYAVVPFLLAIFLSPFGQELYVAGVHFYISRVLIIFGCVRIVWTKFSSRMEIVAGGFTVIDNLFLLRAIVRSLATFLEFVQMQAFVNQVGFLLDTLGGYLLLRFLIRDEEDVVRVIKTFAFIVSILGVVMVGEKIFDRNLFGYIGGTLIPTVRDGAIRAKGSLTGPIQSGTFGATLFCLFAWLWQSGRARFAGAAGAVGSAVMVVTSASSTPLLGALAGGLAIAFWPLRKNMRAVRWALAVLLVTLHLVMKAPVWFLINHVNLIAGNSGDHRAMIIDGFIRHFSEWWLIGVKSTANWGWDMWDQANQFVTEGESGGLATFICFVFLISKSFARLGNARKLVEGNRKEEWMFWLFGAALFSHVVSFFGISFSDQAETAWFALLAMICTVTIPTAVQKLADDRALSRIPTRVPATYSLGASFGPPNRVSRLGTFNNKR